MRTGNHTSVYNVICAILGNIRGPCYCLSSRTCCLLSRPPCVFLSFVLQPRFIPFSMLCRLSLPAGGVVTHQLGFTWVLPPPLPPKWTAEGVWWLLLPFLFNPTSREETSLPAWVVAVFPVGELLLRFISFCLGRCLVGYILPYWQSFQVILYPGSGVVHRVLHVLQYLVVPICMLSFSFSFPHFTCSIFCPRVGFILSYILSVPS